MEEIEKIGGKVKGVVLGEVDGFGSQISHSASRLYIRADIMQGLGGFTDVTGLLQKTTLSLYREWGKAAMGLLGSRWELKEAE